MPNTFIENLQRLQAQNFLSGRVQSAAAELMGSQLRATQNVLSSLNEEMKVLESGNLMTADEQLARLRNNPETQEEFENLEQTAARYQALQQSLMDRQRSYNEVYDRALTALSFIGGEEAGRVSQILRERKLTKEGELENLANLPGRVLEFQKANFLLNWDREKYREWHNTLEKQKQTAEVVDYIMTHPTFGDIPAGNISAWSKDMLQKFNQNVDAVINDAYQHFGGKVDKGIIANAFKLSMDTAGKSFNWSELKPNQVKTGSGDGTLDPLERNSYIGQLSAYTDRWNNMNSELRNQVKNMISEGTIPDTDFVDSKGRTFSTKVLNELYDIYKPGGEYFKYYTMLSGTDPNFAETKEEKLESIGRTLNIPSQSLYQPFIHPDNWNSFADGSFKWNPYWMTSAREKQQNLINDLSNTEIERIPANISNETRDMVREIDKYVPGIVPAFNTFFQSVGETLNDFGVEVDYNTSDFYKLPRKMRKQFYESQE